MKIEIQETDPTKKYPYLGIFESGDIVLFTEKRSGICLRRGVNKVGEYSERWTEEKAKLFTGSITLSND